MFVMSLQLITSFIELSNNISFIASNKNLSINDNSESKQSFIYCFINAFIALEVDFDLVIMYFIISEVNARLV